MKARNLITLLLALALVFTLAACGSEPASETEQPEVSDTDIDNQNSAEVISSDTKLEATDELFPKIISALPSDIPNLEPGNANPPPRCYFYWNIYETLYDYDDSGNLVPDLACELPVEVDDTTYDVKIFDCIYDTDGNNLTASDVVYSFNWLIGTGNAIRFDIFESIEALDDYTVRFHWTEPVASANDLEFPLTRTFCFTEKAWNDHTMATDPCATGNFIVTDYVPGSHVTLEAKEDYWGDAPEVAEKRLQLHQATVKTVEYKIITEASVAATALEMGEIDFCSYIQNSMVDRFKTGDLADKYNVTTVEAASFYFIMPNCAEGHPLSDVNLRKAIFYALDNEAICTVMGGNYAASKTFGTSFYDGYDPAWEEDSTYINQYDLELAKEYLANSSYNNEELVLLVGTSEDKVNAATMIATLLDQIGIKVKISSLDTTIIETTMAEPDGWDMEFSSISGPNLAGTMNWPFNNSVNDGFSTGWLQDDTLQELFDQANNQMDSTSYKALIDYVIENAYFDCVALQSTSIVSNKCITAVYSREGNLTLPCSAYDLSMAD